MPYRSGCGSVAGAILALMAGTLLVGPASAQTGEPIKIGFSMALTGGLAPNGKSALLAQKLWEEDVNAKGGLLGRPVKLVYYDDKSSPAEVPAIYTKLLDVDKVELVVGPYATAQIAPAMPIVDAEEEDVHRPARARGQHRVQLSELLRDDPVRSGRQAGVHQGFFRRCDGAEARSRRRWPSWRRTQEFSRNASDGARENAKAANLRVVYDRTYPPSTADFAPIVRAIQASNPDLVVVCSYPPDSVGIVRAVNEIGFKPKMIGGAMVGLQATAIKTQLGPLLNGWINYDFWLPVPKMEFAGVGDLIKQYQAKAGAEGVDPLGYYMAPWGYAQLQVLQQAVEGTKSLDDAKLADYIRANTFKTVVGDVKFGAKGEWEKSRVLQVQFQNVKGNDVAQFKDMSTQVVVAPAEYESGKVIFPYEKAK